MALATRDCDVLIVGSGIVGATMALALHRTGLRIALLSGGRKRPAGPPLAIAAGCWRLLETLGPGAAMAAHAQAITSIEARGRTGRFKAGLDDLGDDDADALAYVVAPDVIDSALGEALDATPDIRRIDAAWQSATPGPRGIVSDLSDASRMHAYLVIACDGRASKIRRACSIPYRRRRHDAAAIVFSIAAETASPGVALQIFLPTGPLAFLPMTGKRLCVIWTETRARARALHMLDDPGFIDEFKALCKAADTRIGSCRLLGARQHFPLAVGIADRLYGPRTALAGDAGHTIHPLAGQGLNLGLKDIAALSEIIGEAHRCGLDIGADTVLHRYENWRRVDVTAMAAMTETLAGLADIRGVCGHAMTLAGCCGPLRRTLVRTAAALQGDLPPLLQGGHRSAH